MKKARKLVPKKRWWKLASLALLLSVWVFAVIVAMEFLTSLAFVLILGKETFSTPLWTTIYTSVLYILSCLILIFVTPKIARKWGFLKSTRKSLGLEGLPTWTDAGLAPVGLIVSIALAAVLIFIFKVFPWFDAEQSQNVVYSLSVVGIDRAIAFFALAVLAPIAEEIIFRGWLYGKLRVKLPMPASIIITSLVFGIIHMQWNVGVNVFAMSVVACCLRELTGTIYAGIILHMLKNGLAFFLLFVVGV